MKRLPRGTKAQIMGTRLFQTMYTADQMRKAVADEREACANIDFYEILRDVCNKEQAREYSNYIEIAIRARGNT